MPLGTEVGLGPGHIVLDGDPAPTPFERAQQPPLFGRCLLWPNGFPPQLLLSTCYQWRPVDTGVGRHYPWTRRLNGPCSRVVWTGAREHG